MREELRNSLTGRLVVSLVLPAIGLAIILAIGGAFTIQNIVEKVNDRVLNASARAIADTLALEDGEITLDLPMSAFGMLENEARDNVYYSVWRGRELVTGYPDLPVVTPVEHGDGETQFAYSSYRDAPVRIAAITRRVPRVPEPVIVQVAETLDGRSALRDRMLTSLAIVELLFLALLTFLLPIAVRWGLVPLARVGREIDHKDTADFRPLDLAAVPLEMRGLVEAFNGLLGRLAAAVEGLRRFTADASHQMRTPLSILRTHVDVVRREGPRSAAGKSSLEDIDAATRRLQRLLTQLLALARAEGTREALPAVEGMVTADAVPLLRNVAAEYVPAALREGVDVHFDTVAERALVRTQPALLTELLGNLLDNAIRYNRPEGTVLITLAIGDEDVTIGIEDEGPGIPPAKREDVFRRFYRLRHNQERAGSGLGLAIVRALADTIGARVLLGDRACGTGLRVEVVLPRPKPTPATVK